MKHLRGWILRGLMAAAICGVSASVAGASDPTAGSRDGIPVYQLQPDALPDVHDGTLADWLDLVPGPSLTDRDFVNILSDEELDTTDMSAVVYLGWMQTPPRLYVGVRRIDDKHLNEYTGAAPDQLADHDGVELMVDGDRSGGVYKIRDHEVEHTREEVLLSEQAQAQKYCALATSPDGRSLALKGVGDLSRRWATALPYADSGGAEFPSAGSGRDTTIIEIYVTPWDSLHYEGYAASLASDLRVGCRIGLQIALPDYDDSPGTWNGLYTIFGGKPSDLRADDWVDAVLVQCSGMSCGGDGSTAVPASLSWGRMKSVGR